MEIRDLTDADREEAYALRSQAFGARREPLDPNRPGRDPQRDVVRGAFKDGRLVAAATAFHTAQWFGGRTVPMGGVAGVATAPESRGGRVGPRLMGDLLVGMRERGLVLSTLYPSTTSYYRRLGWEIAGTWWRTRMPARSLASLPRPEAEITIYPESYAETDVPGDCYERVAPPHAGWLDRDEPFWAFRRWEFAKEGGPQRYLYIAERDGQPVGYVTYRHLEDDPRFYGLQIDDLIADDHEATLALLRLVGSNRTVTDRVAWHGAHLPTLMFLLPEQDAEIESRWGWMSRLVDAPGAIAARGYLPGVSVTVALEIHDEHAPWNAGRWVLEVVDGEGRLTPGGSGAVVLEVGTLAALYTGSASPWHLASLGRIDGAEPGDLAALAAAFAGPTPWLPDFF
jgi:predicted acetyltransferase